MTEEWVLVQGEKMMKGDVWRWEETVFEERGPRGITHGVPMGLRWLKAQYVREAKRAGFGIFEVRECRVGESRILGHSIPSYKVGQEIERSYGKILKGKPERLVWGEETERSKITSKYLGNEDEWRAMSAGQGVPVPSARQREAPARRGRRKRSGGGRRPKGASRRGPRPKM